MAVIVERKIPIPPLGTGRPGLIFDPGTATNTSPDLRFRPIRTVSGVQEEGDVAYRADQERLVMRFGDGTSRTIRGRRLTTDPQSVATISGGVMNVTDRTFIQLAAESGTEDELDTVDPVVAAHLSNGDIIVLTADTGDTIIVKHGTGNIFLDGHDFVLVGNLTLALIWAGTAWIPWSSLNIASYVLIEDQKAQNTPGGTFTSGAPRVRDLNTIVSDDDDLASLSANQVTLVQGEYILHATAPALLVNRHQAWLQDVTAGAPGTTIKRGTSGFQISTSGTNPNYSTVLVRIATTSDIIIELQHECATTRATNGFGLEANLGTEVYSQFQAWRLR